jgi:surface carbohydrate biosynthesis protein
MTFWKPDVLILNTVSKITRYKNYSKNTQIYFLAGEGGEPIDKSDASYLKNYPEKTKLIDKYLLWGEYDLEALKKHIPKETEKAIVVGNPRLDLTKFRPDYNLQKEKTIGFISRFNMINQFDRRPLVATLGFDGNLERAEIQCKQFSVFWKIIDHLVQNTNYKISYRAYPLEAHDEIEKIFNKNFGDRVSVNYSLSYAEWVRNQKLVITPATTAFFEPYIIGVPIINIDYLIGKQVTEKSKQLFPFATYIYDVARNPKNYKELFELLDLDLKPIKSKIVDDYLNHVHNYNDNNSALKSVANIVSKQLRFEKSKIHFGFPTWMMEVYNWLIFKYIFYKNPSLKFFHYDKRHHKIPEYCRKVFAKIESNL